MGKSVSKRIGILGGTFNPAHNGHLHVARQALKKLRLSKVIFIPTYISPHKKISGGATVEDRLRMLHLATGENSRFSVSLYEIKAKGKSYSVKTARFLRKRYGKRAELFFLIGADSLAGLTRWKEPSRLFKLLRFAVFARPGFKLNAGPPAPRLRRASPSNILKVQVPGKKVSSTAIRRLARSGKSVRGLLPHKVFRYIEKRKLYRG